MGRDIAKMGKMKEIDLLNNILEKLIESICRKCSKYFY